MGNKTMLTDLYQLTMIASYIDNNKHNEQATFDLFVRKLPKDFGYMLAAGLEDAIDYIQNINFEEDDLEYLAEQGFNEKTIEYLKNFKFECDVYAVPEGTVVYPEEPLIRVTGPRAQVQLLETTLLNIINHQTLIASKASRVVNAAKDATITDFGLRRAHGEDAGMKGARSAYIAGAVGTSNVKAGKEYGIPIIGTAAHSYTMSHDSELESFRNYAKTFPDKAVLLIDTYDTIEGAKNAVIVAKELEKQGHKLVGVRLDSGDLCELSKKVRKIFDENGLDYVKIVASNDLNEYKIKELIENGARIDSYGVGTEMITSKQDPAIAGVYKLVEDEDENGEVHGKMKLSSGKRTLPGKKQVYREINEQGMYVKDVIALEGENIGGQALLVKIFEKGKLVYENPSLRQIRKNSLQNVAKLGEQYKRNSGNGQYAVELSEGLTGMLNELTQKYGGR